jgi:hypothetical protein
MQSSNNKVYYEGEQFTLIEERTDIPYSKISKPGKELLVPSKKIQTEEQYLKMLEEKTYRSHITW